MLPPGSWSWHLIYPNCSTFFFVSSAINSDVKKTVPLVAAVFWYWPRASTWFFSVTFQGSICCGYGTAGATSKGYDCVMIPGATSFANKNQKGNSICGQFFVTVASTAINKTICCKPFMVFLCKDIHFCIFLYQKRFNIGSAVVIIYRSLLYGQIKPTLIKLESCLYLKRSAIATECCNRVSTCFILLSKI